jgi:hypothetical protein
MNSKKCKLQYKNQLDMKANYRRFARLLFSLIIIALILYSCEEAADLIGNATVQKIVGNWTCIEDIARKKSTMESYVVEIVADPENASGILIYGIYGLGSDIYAKADVFGSTITINDNVTGGFQISGTGIIEPNYKEINWTYSVDDGSGVDENFTAIYTKVE